MTRRFGLLASAILAFAVPVAASAAPANIQGFAAYVRSRAAPTAPTGSEVLPLVQNGTTTALPLSGLSSFLKVLPLDGSVPMGGPLQTLQNSVLGPSNLLVYPQGNPYPTFSALSAQMSAAIPYGTTQTYPFVDGNGNTTQRVSGREYMLSLGMTDAVGGYPYPLGSPQSLNNPTDKVALYAGMDCRQGGAPCWTVNTSMNIASGFAALGHGATGYELDMNNNDVDSGGGDGIGGMVEPGYYGFAVTGAGKYAATAALSIGGPGTHAIWHRGIVDSNNAVDQCLICEYGNAYRVVDARGTGLIALDTSQGNYAVALQVKPGANVFGSSGLVGASIGTDSFVNIAPAGAAGVRLGSINAPTTVSNLGAGEVATGPGGALFSTGCLAIESFGGSTGATDNTTALVNAANAASANGGCVKFGNGTYRFTREVDLSIAGTYASLMLRGVSETGTVLVWSPGSNGIVITGHTQYNTMHVRDMSIETADTSGNYYGLQFATTNTGLGVLASSDVTSVTFKGADGGNQTNYWGSNFANLMQSFINLDGDSFFGAQANGSFRGTGVFLRGQWVSAGQGNYSIGNNITKCNFQDLATGLIYGPYVQGTSISQTNFNNGGIGISTIAPASGQDNGILDQLTITTSQFGQMQTANIRTVAGGALDHVSINSTLFYVNGGITGLDFGGGFGQLVLEGNLFQGGNGSNGAPNNNAVGLAAGNAAVIGHNTFYNFVSAILLLPSTSNVTVAPNNYTTVTNKVVDQGSNNIVPTSCATAPTASYKVVDGIVTHC